MSNVTVALLASLAYFISYAGNWALGQCMLERPICVGAITGLLLGDPATGVVMGGALEAIYMGAVNIGGATAAEPVSATVLSVAFAIASGLPMEEAVTLAVPVGLVFNSLGLMLFMLGNAFLPWYSKACDEGDSKAIDQILWSNWLVMYLIRTVIIFFSVYLGSAVVASVMNNLPPAVMNGLSVASGLIGAVGMAILMRMLWNKETAGWYFVGFVIAKYLGLPAIVVAIIGIVIAITIGFNDYKMGNLKTVAAAPVSEEEDFFK